MKWNLSRVTLTREWDRNKQYYSWKEGIVVVPLPKCTPVQSLLAADFFLGSSSQCQGNSPRSWRQSCLLFAAQIFPLCRFSRSRHQNRCAESSTLIRSANSTQASKESPLPTLLISTIPVGGGKKLSMSNLFYIWAALLLTFRLICALGFISCGFILHCLDCKGCQARSLTLRQGCEITSLAIRYIRRQSLQTWGINSQCSRECSGTSEGE